MNIRYGKSPLPRFRRIPVVGFEVFVLSVPPYLSSTPVGFGMHLGKWGLAPTLHIGFFSHPAFFIAGPRITEVSLFYPRE
jgi:hypothetical protein